MLARASRLPTSIHAPLVAACLAAIYLIGGVPASDLAAQVFRANLFDAHGFLIWNNDWYGGQYLTGYSLLYPPIGGLLGPLGTGALAAIVSALSFDALARHRYGRRAWLGSLWFSVATASLLLVGEITFALGVAFALVALVALQRRFCVVAALVALAAACASPLAGILLTLAGAAAAVCGIGGGAGVAVAALAGTAFLSVPFAIGGYFPFPVTTLLAIGLLGAAALIFLPREERVLRRGVWAYLALAVALFVVPTPIGANIARLGSLFGGPVLALAVPSRRRLALLVVAVPLLWWQWGPAIRNIGAIGDESLARSYYTPLLTELRRLTAAPTRVEIPPTRDRGEAAYVAPHYPLARGWLRQLEAHDIRLFTGGRLTPHAYRLWLDNRGVSYVAVSDAKLDYLAHDEVALVHHGLPYLKRIWSQGDWTVYRVRHPTPLVAPDGAKLTHIGPADFALSVRRAGTYLVRIHYTPYWTVGAGKACVTQAGQWTEVHTKGKERVVVSADLTLGGLFGGERSCSG